ncbi:hypothetical protein Ndes2526B_g03286 [Nannochloris sp. 'desiccata']|nr:hypothetical protein KSW81_006497 [Chlorella desiccata (nom. nud.)]
MESLVDHFQRFVTELTTVEKRQIIALTEIARDALRTHPHLAVSLASVLTTRILQAPADLKLPPLYLLDSITKTIGEPYKTYFADSLPDIYTSAWVAGAPGLHRPLDKLLNTWTGVFPPHILDAVRTRVAGAAQAPPDSAVSNGYAPDIPGYGYYGAPAPVPATGVAHHKPMVPDARLVGGVGAGAAVPAAAYDYYGGGYPPQLQQQQQQQALLEIPGYGAPSPQPTSVPLPDLFSLLPSGALAAAATAVTGGQRPLAPKIQASGGTTRLGVSGEGKPASVEFSNERIKEHNLEAVDRLLTVTNLTKSSFLDRLFLRRQKHSSGIHASRLWYVDLDTWMAGTTGAGGAPPDVGAPPAGGANAAGGACSPEQRYSVVADDEQTHCALSGEKFDQFWDEDHQEWRYKDAKKLTAEEGASYGLEEGAIVLVSALGSGPQVAVVGAGPSDEEVKKEEEDEGQGADAKKEEDEGPAQKRIKRE